MIKTDYDNAQLLLKRGDKVIHTFKFKEFVSAKSFKPVNVLRNELVKLQQGKIDKTQEEVEKMERDFYDKVTQVGLDNPLSFTKAMDIMTIVELSNLSEEILLFLVNWSTTEAVKQFAKQLSETDKKETKP